MKFYAIQHPSFTTFFVLLTYIIHVLSSKYKIMSGMCYIYAYIMCFLVKYSVPWRQTLVYFDLMVHYYMLPTRYIIQACVCFDLSWSIYELHVYQQQLWHTTSFLYPQMDGNMGRGEERDITGALHYMIQAATGFS